MTSSIPQLAVRLRAELGDHAVITDPAILRTYECDGLTAYRATPGIVLLPTTAYEIQRCVRACRHFGIPFVARGSGTEQSDGAMPIAIGALIVTSKLNRIIEVDAANRRVVVEPGVLNTAISAYDLTGVFIGSEGTLGIATKVYVRLLREPESVVTMLAAFETIEGAGAAASAVIPAGITPAAAEIRGVVW